MPRTTRRIGPAHRALPALLVLGLTALTACGPTATGATRITDGSVSSTVADSATAGTAPSASATSGASGSGNSSTDKSSKTTTAAGDGATAAPVGGGSATSQSSSSSNSSAAGLSGDLHRVAGITDGDTIKVWVGDTKETVRLLGVDTPESKKPHTAVACYAKQATSKMQSLVQSKDVRLVADPTQADRDRYGRLVRYVVLPDGRDVSQQLIAGGFGREYTYAAAYAKQSAFRTAQSQAQTAKRGLWGACTYAAAFQPPTTGTPAQPTAPVGVTGPTTKPTSKPPAQPKGQCVIKGNINSKGEKIYHLPGQQHYADTVITPSKGERWFCSEQEAQAAGWRRAKV